ncbi:MAG: Gfo/Idh/MocA family oxidoreductase [SAR324 cluster bacterium]|nr:Gfo/Idh/MocA family oxidoreductase [SAR324 cluster bacterium]MBL7036197.1 Gfo/Idh/MocA family oxidoreductase [SAR324 cluster bacterium]
MKTIGIGLVGSGFMGRCHANAYSSVAGIFDVPLKPVLKMLADANLEMAEAAAQSLQFENFTSDWQKLVDHPEVELVDITAPNHLHAPIALAAIAKGKPVYCEKPLACTLAEAKAMRDAATSAGVATLVGYNYLQNPMIQTAREIVQSGEIGELLSFRGVHAEDFMADAQAPYTTRLDAGQGGGALYDIGSHIISLARFLVGPISEVMGMQRTVYPERPEAAKHSKISGSKRMKTVKVDDQTHFLARFENGCCGTLEANWLAWGRKMNLAFELNGSKGTLVFTQEHFNELRLYQANQQPGRDGFKILEAGPNHGTYAKFCPAPGHQLGFNELKIIEVFQILHALGASGKSWPDFHEAYEIQKILVAVNNSAKESRWCSLDEIDSPSP